MQALLGTLAFFAAALGEAPTGGQAPGRGLRRIITFRPPAAAHFYKKAAIFHS
jgi:hypothetical protein